ncbi:sulfate permease [Colletotrichum sojae]|uniref:Sulfate permease n=1 Tax=Colletotrichum sojae TaxID=2175907 RepID=A0A8H6IQF6_9PEZI|nr:sulfate permease [Colletotrichum sojae]
MDLVGQEMWHRDDGGSQELERCREAEEKTTGGRGERENPEGVDNLENANAEREATYLIFINTLKNLPKTKMDAVMGLTALT